MTALALAAVLLAAAAFFAPLAKRIGLGSVVGYLGAGMLIGPAGFGLIYSEKEVDEILHLAEFGVVLLLFLIGLELRPQRLWSMRQDIFGAGAAQVGITTAILTVIGLMMGIALLPSIVIAAALAFSSTAFVLQFLGEKGQLAKRHGRMGFSILIFQDLAAVPLIALIPLLAIEAGGKAIGVPDVLVMLASVAGVLFLGRYVVRYVYRFVAATGVEEGMTAAALLTVVLVTLLMEAVGLSAALGAYLAGMLIGGSEYRHEIEANIAPFERILLGVFFTAVGMALDLSLLINEPVRILCFAFGLLAIKAAVLFGVALWRGLNASSALLLAVVLAQGGEFAFVVFGVAIQSGLMASGIEAELAVAVTLSMALTPILYWMAERAIAARSAKSARPADDMPEHDTRHIIVAGFTAFGQIPARIFSAKHIPFTALDASTERIDFVRRFGANVYFGDASRPELLAAAGAHNARAIILAMHDPEAITETARTVRRLYPDLPIYARARDRLHAYELLDLGVKAVERETFHSALVLSERLLVDLGESPKAAADIIRVFKELDEARFQSDWPYHKDIGKLADSSERASAELERQFQRDQSEPELSEGAAEK